MKGILANNRSFARDHKKVVVDDRRGIACYRELKDGELVQIIE